MKQQKKSWVKTLLSFAEPCKGKMILSVLCAIFSVAGGFVPFWAVYEILLLFINRTATLSNIMLWCLVGVGGYLIRVICFGISTILAHISAYTILEGIRLKIANRLMRASLGEVMGRRIGYLKNIIMDKVEDLEPPLAHMIPELTSNLLLPIAIFIWMLAIDWRLGLAVLIAPVLAMIPMFFLMRNYNSQYAAYMGANNHVNNVIIEYVEGMLKEGFYHRPLTVIRPIDIENFLKGMRRDGRSDSYISKARGMLYQIFQKAEANDLVRRNPVRLAEKMRASGTAKRKEAFTTAEVAHLMKVLPDDRMGLSIRLLLGTGMRMQELLALEPQFIEEDGSVIHIRQAVKVVKGTVSIGSPKSKDSIRDIPVPLNVRPCAIKLRDTTDQFIWESSKTGLPCNPTHFRDVFRKSLEEAGDVRLLTPHSCRHTYVSQMQALGVDIQTIQSIVGHADTEMTEHYLHVQESIRQSAIQLFSEAFSA